jgi:hypothetical protein
VPKPAVSSLDRVCRVPTADPWVVRSGPAVSVELAGFQVSAPDRASENRCVADCEVLDLTFSFSFADLLLIFSRRQVVAIVLTPILGG